MIIVSQDKRTIMNFNNIGFLNTNYDIYENKGFVIEAVYQDKCIICGKYETEERAKEVLKALYDWFSVKEKFDSKTWIANDEAIAQALTGQLRVFEMPKR